MEWLDAIQENLGQDYQNTLALAVGMHGNWAEAPSLPTPRTHAPALPEQSNLMLTYQD